MWRGRGWAWYASFAVGCGLVIWIGVQVTIVPFDVLQVIYLAVGVLIATLTLLPSVQRACRPGHTERR